MLRRALCHVMRISSSPNRFLNPRHNIKGIQVGVVKINSFFSSPSPTSTQSIGRRPLTEDEKDELEMGEKLKKMLRRVANYIPFFPYERIATSEHLTRTQLNWMEKIPEIQITHPDVVKRYEKSLVEAGRQPVRVSEHFILVRAAFIFMIGVVSHIPGPVLLGTVIYYMFSSTRYRHNNSSSKSVTFSSVDKKGKSEQRRGTNTGTRDFTSARRAPMAVFNRNNDERC